MQSLLERAIEERGIERYKEGTISEAFAEYFENGGVEDSYATESEGEQRERGRIGQIGGRVARREGTADLFNPSQTSHPPFANRGVTFNNVSLQKTFSPKYGGYDGGIELGFTGTWQFSEFKKLKEFLETVKEESIEQANKHEKPITVFELNNKSFVMLPRSAECGVLYRYVFEGMGVKIYIHQNPKGEIQPIRVCYLAVGLIGRDFFHKHSEVREFIESLGFEISGEKLSRVDMQVMVNRPMSEFVEAYHERRIVCTAQTRVLRLRGDKAETLTIGKQLQVCIYDKRAELEKAMVKDPVKCALMLNECLGDDFLSQETPLTRIEFRLKRPVLLDMGIDTVSDLLEHEQAIINFCCKKWFRILDEPKQKGHSSIQKVSELWQEVQGAFSVYFPGVEGHNQELKIERKHEIRCDAKHLHAQSRGCYATSAALELGGRADVLSVLCYVLDKVGSDITNIFTRYKERVKALGSRVFGSAVEPASGCCASYHEIQREIQNWFEANRDYVIQPKFEVLR